MKPFWRSIFFKSAFGSTALSQSSSWWVSSPSAELHATDPTFYGNQNQKQPLSCFFLPRHFMLFPHMFFLFSFCWKNSEKIKSPHQNLSKKHFPIWDIIMALYITYHLFLGNQKQQQPPCLAMSVQQRGNSWPRSAVMLSSKLRRKNIVKLGLKTTIHDIWNTQHVYICTQKNNVFWFVCFVLVFCWVFGLVGCKVEAISWLATDFSFQDDDHGKHQRKVT